MKCCHSLAVAATRWRDVMERLVTIHGANRCPEFGLNFPLMMDHEYDAS